MLSEKLFKKLLELSIFVLFLITPLLFSQVLATSKASLLKMTVSNILVLWIVALIAYAQAKKYITRIIVPKIFIIFLVYIGYVIIIYLFRKDFYQNVYEFNKLVLFIISILFFQFVDLKKTMTLFTPVFVIILLYGLLQSLGYDFVNWGSYSRIFSTFGNPNFYSPFVLLFLPLYFVLFYKTRKALYGIITVLALWNIYASRTRGAMLGTAFILIVFFSIELIKKLKIRFVYFVLTVGFVLAAFTFYTSYRHGENLSFIKNFNGTMKERVVIWQSALRAPRSAQLFGYGYGSFKRYFPHYASMFFTLHEGNPNIMPSYAHNEYVEQIFEVGAIGLSIFLLAFFTPIYFRLQRRANGKEDIMLYGLTLGVFAVLFQNAFGVNLHYATTATYLFFIFGYIAAYDSFTVKLQYRKEISYLILVLSIIAAAFAVVPIMSSTYQQAGNDYDINKNPNNSFKMYQRAYMISKRNDVALYKMGYYMHKYKGNAKKSLYYYKTLLKIAPYYPEVRYTIGTIYYTEKDLGNAYDILSKDIDDVYYNAKSHNNLANVYSDFGKWRYALNQYKAAYYIDPNLALAYVNAGIIYLDRGMPDKAVKEFKTAISHSPQYGLAWTLLSRAYQKLGKTYLYQKALKMASTFGSTNNAASASNDFEQQAKDLFNQKKYKKALIYFEKALRLSPRSARYYNNVGLCYFHLYDMKNAEAYYKKGIEFSPDDKLLLTNLAILYAKQKRYVDEINVLERYYNFYKDSWSKESLMIRYRNEGARLFNAGKRKAVIPYWEKYRKLGGNEPSIIQMLARLKKQFK